MIPRKVTRMFDQRSEPRVGACSGTAVLSYRGRNHVVPLVNLSSCGAMIDFAHVPHIGERMDLQFMERGTVAVEVRWVKEGRVGLAFAGGLE